VDRRRRARMGEAATAFARRYSMAAAAEGTFGEYRRFLAERARASTPAPVPAAVATAYEPVAAAAGAAAAAVGGVPRAARSRNDAGGVS